MAESVAPLLIKDNILREEVDGNNDIIIALFGTTGSGKSNFIDKATGRPRRAGNNLYSVTKSISATKLEFLGHSVILLDLPGFADSALPDVAILKMVSDWLGWEKGSNGRMQLCGVLYCHSVTDTRMSSMHIQNLTMIQTMCRRFYPMVLVTTFWDLGDPDAEIREAQLQTDFWAEMLTDTAGATTRRFGNQPGSAYEILQLMVEKVQEAKARTDSLPESRQFFPEVEIKNHHRYLKITKAGKNARSEMERRLHERQDREEALQAQLAMAQQEGRTDVVELLGKKVKDVDQQVRDIKKVGESLDVSFLRRFSSFMMRKLDRQEKV